MPLELRGGQLHSEKISWPDFEKVELIAGTIVEVEEFPEAKSQLINFALILDQSMVSSDQVVKLPISIKKKIS